MRERVKRVREREGKDVRNRREISKYRDRQV